MVRPCRINPSLPHSGPPPSSPRKHPATKDLTLRVTRRHGYLPDVRHYPDHGRDHLRRRSKSKETSSGILREAWRLCAGIQFVQFCLGGGMYDWTSVGGIDERIWWLGNFDVNLGRNIRFHCCACCHLDRRKYLQEKEERNERSTR